MTGAAADPDFTPQVPGLSDTDTIKQWELPSLVDARRIRGPDEDYWKTYRGTPKAFISLATGRELWKSRFGQTTLLRIADESGKRKAESAISAQPQAAFQLPAGQAARVGGGGGNDVVRGVVPRLQFVPPGGGGDPGRALVPPGDRTPRGGDRHPAGRGIPPPPGRVAVGRRGVSGGGRGRSGGIGLGIGYAALLVVGLRTWWLGAVITPLVRLYVTPASLAVGYASGLIVAVLAILVCRRPHRPASAAAVAGRRRSSSPRHSRRPGDGIACCGSRLGRCSRRPVGLGLFAARLGEEAQAGALLRRRLPGPGRRAGAGLDAAFRGQHRARRRRGPGEPAPPGRPQRRPESRPEHVDRRAGRRGLVS